MGIADVAVASLSAVLGFLTLAGLATRYVLLPYLKEHLIKPVAETRNQVTVNHHSSPTPTVLDRIDDVSQQVHQLSLMFDRHLDWSQQEVDALWAVLNRRRAGTDPNRPPRTERAL